MFLLCIESFAAVVSDNDGSAFITKSEFDSLKNNFQAQLDSYNTSIDSKIDNAIASYLSGITMDTQHEVYSLLKDTADNYTITFNQSNPLRYVFGWPRIRVELTNTRWTSGGRDNIGTAHVVAEPIAESADTQISKTLIKNLFRRTTSSPWIAEWAGYRIKCSDYIELYGYDSTGNGIDGNPRNIGLVNLTKQGASNCNLIKNTSLIGQYLSPQFRTSVGTDRTTGSSPMLINGAFKTIQHNWGENKYPFAICWQPYDYDMFSNYDRDYNWGYDGTYITSFKSFSNPETWATGGADVHSYFNYTSATPQLIWMYQGGSSACTGGSKNIIWGNYMVRYVPSSTGKMFIPMIGFERNYLTNWNQIYLPDTEDIALFDIISYPSQITGSIIQTSGMVYNLSMSAGLPIVKLKENQDLDIFNVDFEDGSKDYIIWVSERPFPSNQDPKDTSNLVKLKKLDKIDDLNGYKIKNGYGSFGYENTDNDEKYLYIKWGILNDTDTVATCGGAIKVGKTYTVKEKS